MAHYRRGHKVPAMGTRRRDVAGLLTIGFVFALVAATAWRPLWFVLPSLVVVLGLVIFDYAVVDLGDPGEYDGPDSDAAAAGFLDEADLDVAALAAAQTMAYRADVGVTKAWPSSPARPVAPPPPPGRSGRGGARRASWLDDTPGSGDATRQFPAGQHTPDGEGTPAAGPWDRHVRRDLDAPTGAVDMRAFLD